MPEITFPSEADRTALELAISILKRHGALAVYLFGSMASGTARSDSDWDIAVWEDLIRVA